MTTPLPRGVLIAFEGIDGSGKSTQMERVARWAEAQGLEVIRTKEPTTGPWGMKLRASQTQGRMSAEEELNCFLEDRREHVETLIRPAVARGAMVLVDRYYYSTVAYQGARGMDPQALLAKNRAFAPKPDLVVLVDVDPRISLERIKSRGQGVDLFESLEEQLKVRAIFNSLKEPHILTIDGSKSKDEMFWAILVALVQGPLKVWADAKAKAEPEGELARVVGIAADTARSLGEKVAALQE